MRTESVRKGEEKEKVTKGEGSYEREKYTSEPSRFPIGSFVLFYTKANNDARPEKDNRLRTAPIIKASSICSCPIYSLPHSSYTFIFFICKVGGSGAKERNLVLKFSLR